MTMSSLTYIPGFSVKFFFQPILPIMQIRHIFSSDTVEPNYTKSGRDGPWVGSFKCDLLSKYA
jgi:hypothetical protein